MTAAAFLPISVWVLFWQHLQAPAPAPEPAAKQLNGFPYTDETLNYSVNWPTGLSLGEAHLHATKDGARWRFEMSLDASVPGFGVADRYRSTANADLCSLDLDKQISHGKHSAHERTTFDYQKATATRKNLSEGGGHTDFEIDGCARDALDFVFYTRRELGQGRVPPADTVLLGASYSVHLEYTGEQDVTLNKKHYEADRVIANVDGPASSTRLEMLFDRDPARTLLVVRAPFAMGTLSMELVR